MVDLPTGTVTFLFTDVEGSTRLLQELGDRYADVLAEHRRLLRGTFAAHGGVEVDTQGDAFFVVFAKARDALAAAAEVRQVLEPGRIRVRMGLHTGEPVLTDEGYVGIDVHRAARIAAAGHGGQILVSQSTRDLVRDGLRDLGDHRLKDLTAPERIYQLGDCDFPPLRSLNQSNLPVQPTPLIGRERELHELAALLQTSRLVTLTGAGGSGKTRLALQAAADAANDFPDGTWFVSLASLTEPEFVEPKILQVLGGKDDLDAFLRGKDVLLVLDNLEQLLPEVASVVASLEANVIATSRERLNVAGEQEYLVPTLPLDDGVELFTQRARQLSLSFEPDPNVAAISRRLDGLPLALELAAGLVKVLTPGQIASRLEKSLDVLGAGARDAPERHRTLRATIEWSYRLLNPGEQGLFTRLAVFSGSFDLAAADAVARAEISTLGALVDKSLLRRTSEGRFFMLETIREFATELLDASEEGPAVRLSHAEWIGALTLNVVEDLRGENQVEILDLLAIEHANIRAALSFAIETRNAELAVTIAGCLGRFWIFRGHEVEGHRWLQAALALPSSTLDGRRWRALYWYGILADDLGEEGEALRTCESALELARFLAQDRLIAASALELGRRLLATTDVEGTERLLDEAALRSDEHGLAVVAYVRGQMRLKEGDAVSAAAWFAQTVEIDRRSGDLQGLSMGLAYLAQAEALRDRREECRAALRESLTLSGRLVHAWGVATCLQAASALAVRDGDSQGAGALIVHADCLLESLGVRPRGIEGDLYRQRWNEVASHISAGELEALKTSIAGADLDEALAYALRYLD